MIHIEVTDRMERAEPAWRELSAAGNLVTPYQNYDFCALWLRHVGEPAGMQPFLVIGRDDEGVPVFLWPLVRAKVGPCRIATYFCGSHANFKTTLWRRELAASVTTEDLQSILGLISGKDVDALVLLNQPETWNGMPNPFRQLPHQPSADENYGISLNGATGDEVISRHLNRDTRRKFKRKEKHLAKLPGFRYARAGTAEDVDRYVAAFLRQKTARLSALGIKSAFAEPGMEEFLRAAGRHRLPDGKPLLEIHALDSDTEVLALYLGVHDSECFSAMFNSYTLSDNARRSPGYTLLLKMVDDCVERGFGSLNLGVGAAAYKSSLCDLKGHHFDSFIGLTMRGQAYAFVLRMAYALKGKIKRKPLIWRMAHSLRARLFARSVAE